MDNTFAMLVLLPALAWVIASDLLYRRIHNLLILILLALWLVLPLSAPFGLGPWAGLDDWALLERVARSLVGVLLVLGFGYALFCLGRVGAGDVKLMAVLCLWVGLENQMAFLIVTALAGGLLALALPLLSRVESALALGWQQLAVQYLKIDVQPPTVLTEQRPQGIPYGLAIATGALYTLFVPIHS